MEDPVTSQSTNSSALQQFSPRRGTFDVACIALPRVSLLFLCEESSSEFRWVRCGGRRNGSNNNDWNTDLLVGNQEDACTARNQYSQRIL